MRIPLGTALLLLLLAQAPAEDSKPAAQMPTVSARTALVLVPTLVRDKSGASVTGLSREDFALLENGAEQKIAVFEEVKTAAVRASHPSLPAGEFSNVVTGDPATRRLTIIMMDSINTQFADRSYAREQILKFLGEMSGSKEPIALLQLHRGGVRVIHDFTTDPAVLAKALRRSNAAPDAAAAETEEDLPDRILTTESQQLTSMLDDMEQNLLAAQRMLAARLTLDGMEQIARAFAAIPGRKSVIWASGGFPFSIDDLSRAISGSGGFPAYLTEILPLYEKTWRALNDANVALYPVDVRGLVVLAPDASSRRMSTSVPRMEASRQRTSWAHQDTLSTFNAFADMTGGKAYFNSNDLVHAFHDAVEDSSSYYLLGFYLGPDDRKPGWRKLQVKVKQAHAHVRSRSGVYVMPEEKDKNKSRMNDILMAMTSPLEFTSLPLRGRWTATTPAGEKKRMAFDLVIPADAVPVDEPDQNHMNLEFEYAARDANGKVVASNGRTVEAHFKPETLAHIRSGGLTYQGALELPAGEYSVRFVVRDNLSGRLGSVSAPLTVP